MKTINIKIVALLSLIGTMVSCDMEREMPDTLTKEQIDAQYTLVKGKSASLYNDLVAGYFTFGNGMEASASDEADLINGGTVQVVNTGSWNQYSNPDDVLSRYYTAIRRVNDFLNPSVASILRQVHKQSTKSV